MFFRLRRHFKQSRFNRTIGAILTTPPIVLRDAPWTIISMVASRDVPMYLLALKSLYVRLGRGKVIAIVDRDLPQPQREILAQHLVGIRFQILEDIDTGPCQRGGTWERVLYVVEHSEKEYAIQLDSDTLTFGDISEVIEALHANRAFTLGSSVPRDQIEPMASTAAFARTLPGNLICTVAERLYDRYPGHENRMSVRASSGFAGFAKGGFPRVGLEEFHAEMQKMIPDRWHEWGSEQCASNFAIANTPDALVLPMPKYDNYLGGSDTSRTSFYHFIGTYRYNHGVFADLAHRVIGELKSGTPQKV